MGRFPLSLYLILICYLGTSPAFVTSFEDLNYDGGVHVTDVKLSLVVALQLPMSPL